MYKSKLAPMALTILVAATLIISGSGCSEPAADAYAAVQLDVHATDELCTAEDAPDCSKGEFCAIKVEDPKDSVDLTVTKSCIPMDLTSGEADGSFPDLGAEGWFFIGFRNLAKGHYVLYDDINGLPVQTTVYLYSGVNKISAVISINGTITPTDPGDGDFCTYLVDADGNPFDKACDYTVDNASVEVTEDAELCPDGVLISGLTAGEEFTIGAECPDGYTGEEEAKAVKDEVTPVTIEVTKKTTSLCLNFAVDGGGTVDTTQCKIIDLLSGELVSETAPTGLCEGDALYFPSVDHGDERMLHVKCDEGENVGAYTLIENVFNNKWVTFGVGGTVDDACYVDNGDNLNPDKLELHLQKKLGHNDSNGECQPESVSTNFASWSITGITDNADCNAFGDPSCLVALSGTNVDIDNEGNYGHLTLITTLPQIETLPVNGAMVNYLTVDNGSGSSFVMTAHVVNDVVAE